MSISRYHIGKVRNKIMWALHISDTRGPGAPLCWYLGPGKTILHFVSTDGVMRYGLYMGRIRMIDSGSMKGDMRCLHGGYLIRIDRIDISGGIVTYLPIDVIGSHCNDCMYNKEVR